MSYLEQYDSIPNDQVAEKVKLVSRWIRTDWKPFFKELREKRPIFKTPAFTFVTQFKDVQEVLSREEIFSVRLYQSKMDPVVGGPFMLSRDDTEVNWRERGIMQAMLQREELPALREMSKEIAEEALDKFAASGKIEVINELGRYVPVMMCGEYFGFPGPNREAMYRWSKAAQTNMFKNLPNDPKIQQAAEQAGQEMRTYLTELLKAKKAEIAKEVKEERKKKRQESRQFRIKKLLSKITNSNTPQGTTKPLDDDDLEDTFTRLIETHFSDDIHFDDARIISNMCGLLIGTVETTSQAIVHVIEQLLLNPAIFEGALKAAKTDDNKTFDKYVWEALRFNPINPLIFRYCEQDYVLAAGTERETLIPKGTTVFACTSSAMFDAKELPEPERFSLDRPDYHYMHFGYGHHICIGKYIGLVQIPEVVKRVILRPGVRLIAAPEGKIDFKGGPFPESFVIAYGDNMETQEKKVLETFMAYNKSFITLQPEMAAPFFDESALFMSPQGAIFMANQAVKLGVFSKIMADLKAKNYKYTELKNLNVKMLSDGMAVVNADGYRYKTDGQELERYTLTYTLRKVENNWKIIVGILHDIGKDILEDLLTEKKRPIWITGHSLGGGLAVLAAAACGLELKEAFQPEISLYTYGQPRVGDEDFNNTLLKNIKTMFRIVNNNDIVARIPIDFIKKIPAVNYKHVGKLIYLDTQNKVHLKDLGFWEGSKQAFFGRLKDFGKPGTDGIKDHNLGKYIEISKGALDNPNNIIK